MGDVEQPPVAEDESKKAIGGQLMQTPRSNQANLLANHLPSDHLLADIFLSSTLPIFGVLMLLLLL